jgi:hypothetical protein
MSEEAKGTGGIGAKTAHNIQCMSTKKPLKSLHQNFVNSAKQRKQMEIANVKQ